MADLTQLQSKYKLLKSQGKTESTSKEMGKLSKQISLAKKSGGSSSTGTTGNFQSSVLNPQIAKENEFLNRYTSKISSLPKITDIFNRLSTEKGLPQLQSASRGLQASLEAVPEQEQVAGKQFGISTSRLGRRIADRQTALAPLTQRAITQEQTAQGDIADQLQLENAQAQQQLVPFEKEAEMISNRLAASTTGWSVERQGELNTALEKLKSGWAADAASLANIAALAKSEDEFEKEKELIKFKTQNTSNKITWSV